LSKALTSVPPADPGQRELASLKSKVAVLKGTLDPAADLHPLIASLSTNPAAAPQAEMLKALQQSRDAVAASRSGATPSTKSTRELAEQFAIRLRQIAGKFPQNMSLQSMLVQQYLLLHKIDDAAAVAERAMDARPDDPEPAQLAYSVYESDHRWRDARRAAEKWRDRSLDNPTAADVAIASAMTSLGKPNDALQQLAPYLDRAKADPEHHAAIIEASSRAMVVAGNPSDARAMLEPLLSRDVRWRRHWLRLAARDVATADEANDWLKRAESVIGPDAQLERLQLAEAWVGLADRLHAHQFRQTARSLLRELAAKTDAQPAALFMLATMDAQDGDRDSAEALYRRILKDHPEQADAQNNLAYLLLLRNEKLDEAKALATQAVEQSPDASAFHDTLARIDEKLGMRDESIANFQTALSLDPDNLQAMVGMANTLSTGAQPDRDKASALLRRIESLLQRSTPAPSIEALKPEIQSIRARLSQAS
jgi:tetratricopeptide (TPR) repeat protein